MPARVVTSSGGRLARWARMPLVRAWRGAVTSIAFERRTPHRAAAARWLRTAPGPAASTAAIHRPRIDSAGVPDRVDAGMNDVKPSPGYSPIDRVAAQPECE